MDNNNNIPFPKDDENSTAVDWRGRPSNSKYHGGARAAAFVLGLQAFEIMAIAAVGNNLITYLINDMHFSLPHSANIVTNFVGTIFLVALLGGFLSDSFLGTFSTVLIFALIELSGFILLSAQAHFPKLKPPPCDKNSVCTEATGLNTLIFYIAIYMVALGSGCVKPSMISHGANQFTLQSNKLSTYFNATYFAFSLGELIALTVLIWVQTHSGMDAGFAVSAAVMAMAFMSFISGTLYYRNKSPQPTVFRPILQVFVAAILKRKKNCSSTQQGIGGQHSKKLRFLEKACIQEEGNNTKESHWRLCSVEQVEQAKILLSVIPIFACTIIFNTVLAQLQTFSVQQGSAMDTNITESFRIPPASLQAIPYVLLIVIVPLYDTLFVPFARKITGHESGITPLQRIGVGLFLVTFSMVSAAIMEKKRRDAALNMNQTLSIFWIAPQFIIFGMSEMFTAVGLIEFFYTQSLNGMQTFLTSITYCSYSFGFYLSSVLVSLVNKITSSKGGDGVGGWLHDNNINKDKLDLFYWLLAALSFLNFLNYLFWSRWYSNVPSLSTISQEGHLQSTESRQHNDVDNNIP
ncbi:protein NRT1/ PTR FAMILY 4.4-like [Vicia villosa]|uniref:protein NRT1/ PTR FAMILY 4.4-like n=1 Tax=Vicia villosa TaxID=3911 RepID=UPI00273CDAF0|nr:protein NRT1/ PTR FAMILY 4.4-like [Vicia villosa]